MSLCLQSMQLSVSCVLVSQMLCPVLFFSPKISFLTWPKYMSNFLSWYFVTTSILLQLVGFPFLSHKTLDTCLNPFLYPHFVSFLGSPIFITTLLRLIISPFSWKIGINMTFQGFFKVSMILWTLFSLTLISFLHAQLWEIKGMKMY